jgi:prolyl 4-hydroxylase
MSATRSTRYMSDVPKGGETVFPRAGGVDLNGGYGSANSRDPGGFTCDVGLRVRPERGKVVLFYNLLPNGNLDDYSLHGSCPVLEGEKWAANKWIWNQPHWYVDAAGRSRPFDRPPVAPATPTA